LPKNISIGTGRIWPKMTADKARKTERKDTQNYLVVSYDKWTILLNLVSDEIRGG
jgi:hypothetical protein